MISQVLLKLYKGYSHTFAVILLSLFVFLGFRANFGGFFEQDEWLGYTRHILLQGESLSSILDYAFSPSAGHYIPLTLLSVFLSFSLFDLNYPAHFAVSITLHLGVVLLVYMLGLKIFNQKIYALFCALLFGVLASTSQATTWVVADISTHLSTFFGVLSFLVLIHYAEQKQDLKLYLSLSLLVISLLFKEVAISLFLLMPLYYIFFTDRRKQKLVVLSFLIITFIYGGIRLSMINRTAAQRQAIGISTNGIKSAFYLVNSFSQVYLPVEQSKHVAGILDRFFFERATDKKATPEHDLFRDKYLNAGIVTAIFLVGVITFLLLLKRSSESTSRILVFSFLWIFLSSFIYILSPERKDILYIEESRNLYFPAIGSAIFLLTVANCVFTRRVAYIAIAVIIVLNFYMLQAKLESLLTTATLRREILETIKRENPKLEKNSVFYIESDSSFYGLPENVRVPPFQSGFGQTLLAWFYSSEAFPKGLYKNRFLWYVDDQGYKKSEDRGFGYFRDFELFAQTVKEIGSDQVGIIGYRYDSTQRKIANNTSEIKGRLLGYLSQKQEIGPHSFRLIAQDAIYDLPLAKDGQRETAWRTSLPYGVHQSIDISLDSPREIAQIDIDVYNDKDQNQVGFAVSASSDGENWKEVFYSKRYTPVDGVIKIYIEPIPVRFLRLKQVGSHSYAPWVVHELLIYEKVN